MLESLAAPQLPAARRKKPARVAVSAMGTTAGNRFPSSALRKQTLRPPRGRESARPPNKHRMGAAASHLLAVFRISTLQKSLHASRSCAQITESRPPVLSDSRAQTKPIWRPSPTISSKDSGPCQCAERVHHTAPCLHLPLTPFACSRIFGQSAGGVVLKYLGGKLDGGCSGT
jgi:hypothetical protein